MKNTVPYPQKGGLKGAINTNNVALGNGTCPMRFNN